MLSHHLFSKCFLLLCLSWKSHAGKFQFSDTHGDFMVLQREPAAAAVYGHLHVSPASNITVLVTVTNNDSGFSYSVDAAVNTAKKQSSFKALLHPSPAGGSYTIDAKCLSKTDASSVEYGCCFADCSKSTVKISNVTFGDVWYCGGQSNMALSLGYSFEKDSSREAILRGQYDNIRIHGVEGNMNIKQPWSTAKQAVEDDKLFDYSSTCWYFGESLVDELAAAHGDSRDKDLPIGLIHTSRGGTMIEEWVDKKTMNSCHDVCIVNGVTPGIQYKELVKPYIDMSIKGWVWYQGENNSANDCILGSSARKSGYACLQLALIESWRAAWSAIPGTTDPLAPFGIVALPESGSLGHRENIGTMRLAQTGGYGVLPNAKMPNTFLVQSYDLDDPYLKMFDSCWTSGCCYPNNVDYSLVMYGGHNLQCTDETSGKQLSCDDCATRCSSVCKSLSATKVYMGLFHPRSKKGIGSRLAQGAVSTSYAHYRDNSVKPGEMEYTMAATGPTLAGCSLIVGKKTSSAVLTILFNQTLLGNDAVVIQEYDTLNRLIPSKLEILIDPDKFCMQVHRKTKKCIDDGSGHEYQIENELGSFRISDNLNAAWLSVPIKVGSSPFEVVADVSDFLNKTSGVPHVYAVRYMWKGSCCDGRQELNVTRDDYCPLSSCPIMGQSSSLPANPFIAKIINGRCQCIPPMDCSADPSDYEASLKGKGSGKYQKLFFFINGCMIFISIIFLCISWHMRPSEHLEYNSSGQEVNSLI